MGPIANGLGWPQVDHCPKCDMPAFKFLFRPTDAFPEGALDQPVRMCKGGHEWQLRRKDPIPFHCLDCNEQIDCAFYYKAQIAYRCRTGHRGAIGRPFNTLPVAWC